MNACENYGASVFKDDFKLGKDLKMGKSRAIILVVFVIWKLTVLIKLMNACENYGASVF